MPRAIKKAIPSKTVRSSKTSTTTKPNKPMTLGDLASKISKLKTNHVLYGLLLIAVFLLGYLFARVQMLDQGTPQNGQTAQIQAGDPAAEPGPGEEVVENLGTGHLPVEGDENAPVTIVEFSDFECPFCKRYFDETLGQIRSEYVETGQAKMYYRHFPLSFHPAANPGALASECANEQGAFWEYHDKVFEEQARISGVPAATVDEELKAMAAELGLNSAQFDGCYDTAQYQSEVDEDLNDGSAAGVSGTPTIFVNGRKIVGAQPFSVFQAIIDEELN